MAIAGIAVTSFACRNTAEGAREDAAEARQEAREEAAEARQEVRDAAAEAREETAEARRDAAEATANAERESREAADRAGNSVSRAADDVGNATKTAARETGDAVKDAGRAASAAIETMDVKTALMADKRVDASHINVDTDHKQKTVTLKGEVPTAAQKATAEQIAVKEATGYRVVNRLVIKS
jgi:osmotically-inducible protein OsmY